MSAVQKEKIDFKQSKKEICGQSKVKEAVHALKLLNEKFVEDLKKQPLLENTAESPVFLQVMLKKIPPPQLMRMIRVPLPHSLLMETSEVCLITGDLDKQNHKAEIEPTVLHYKDLLKKQGVTKVAQIIPLRQLRTEYKTFESKHQLAAAYDAFLTDKKIAGVLPKVLGKSFFKERKFPIQIDMRKQNLKDQIDKALCLTEFSLTCRGNSYALEVARLSMEDDAIIENIKTSFEVLANKLPGKESNILSLYLKTAKSKAIPIYVSLDFSDEVLIKKPRKNQKFKLDELSTIVNTEVKVFRDGRVVLRKMKKESSNYENASEDEKNVDSNDSFVGALMEDEDTQESISTVHEVSLVKKKKGRNTSDFIEMSDDAALKNENSQDFVPKKRKKNENAVELEEISINVELEKEYSQDIDVNKSSAKKKNKSKKSVEINAEMENEEGFHDSNANKSAKKNKSKNTAELEEFAINAKLRNEDFYDSNAKKNKRASKLEEINIAEDNQDSFENKVSKKNKKGKMSISLDQGVASSKFENEAIQDFIAIKAFPKKIKGKKDVIDYVSDIKEVKTDDDTQNSPFATASLRKKNKRSINLSHLEVNKALEEVRESGKRLESKKRKIHVDINERTPKSKILE